ncbi:MAG: transposase [Desulfobacterales bacterium]|nr:MAG: transposase [Desulfobacterales bacterium]
MKQKTKKTKHPDWALKYKRKGTELRLIKGHYYLYEVTSKWNPEKKRSQKITGKLLGKITPEGFIESKKQLLLKAADLMLKQPLFTKEYGISYFILQQFKEYIETLEKFFPDIWKQLVVLTFIRLVYQCPIKNIQFRFEHSFLSEIYHEINVIDKKVTTLLRQLGLAREKVVNYMRSFIQGGDYILADGTHIVSHSQHIEMAKQGYNSSQNYDPQVNLLFLFSSKLRLPVFYRILPGNIRDVTSFKLTIEESGLEDVVIITDKGFYSRPNVGCLDSEQLQYILPLRRNSNLISYENIEQPKKKGFDNYFSFHNKYIWHYTLPKDSQKKVVVFYDEHMRIQEETDYLNRIKTHPSEYSLENFRHKQPSFGTLSLYTNLTTKKAVDIYQYYKSRQGIETMFNAMKNILHADASYMQNEFTLQGWMFINYLALQWYYHIYKLLSEKELIAKYSVKDMLMHLSEIRKIKINGVWKTAEITDKTKTLLKKLEIPIT